MTRIEHIGEQTLILGDCREVMPTLGRFDACVTDPPYSISIKNSINNSPKGKRNFDFFDGDDDWKAMTDLVVEAINIAILKCPKTFVIWCGHRQLGRIINDLEFYGYSTRLLCWKKTCPPPSAPNSGFTSAFEQAIYAYLPKRQWNGNQYTHNIFEADSYRHGQPGKVEHPTQKPLSLINWNIRLVTDELDEVLDPFMGSGTTLVACQQLGRKGTGIEISEKYFDIACKRVEQAAAQPRLFTEPKQKHKQEAML